MRHEDHMMLEFALLLGAAAVDPDEVGKTYSPDDTVAFTMSRRTSAAIGAIFAIANVVLDPENIKNFVQGLDGEDTAAVNQHLQMLAGDKEAYYCKPISIHVLETALWNADVAKRYGAQFAKDTYRLYGNPDSVAMFLASMDALLEMQPTKDFKEI